MAIPNISSASLKANEFNQLPQFHVPVDTYYDGSAMTDAKCGGLYNKINGSYIRFANIEVRLSQLVAPTQDRFAKVIAEMDALGGGRLIIDAILPITSNITVPASVTIVANKLGRFQIASGITLTINGHVENGLIYLFELANRTSILSGNYKSQVDLNVINFGAVGDGATDDSTSFQHAIDSNRRIFIPPATYYFATHVMVTNAFFHIYGSNPANTIITGTGFINSTDTVTVDTSFPTQTDPGPLKYCAFYCHKFLNYPIWENITFKNFRFATTHILGHNTPTFKNIILDTCNAFAMYYQGCQNPNYINIRAVNSNVFHISSATCFASDNPYKSMDNYYTDGLVMANYDKQMSFSGFAINAAFDTWFVGTFLRPSVTSITSAGSYLYTHVVNGSTITYADTDDESCPSGRAAFIPMRNPRIIYGAIFRNTDNRGNSYRGTALLNSTVYGLLIDSPKQESIFTGYTGSHPVIFSVASSSTGAIYGLPTVTAVSVGFIISPTNRFNEDKDLSSISFLASSINLEQGVSYQGLVNGNFYNKNKYYAISEDKMMDTLSYIDTRTGASVQGYFDVKQGDIVTDNVNQFTVDRSNPVVINLPYYDATNARWCADVMFRFKKLLAGKIEFFVQNLTTGEADYGAFRIDTTNSATAISYTTSADINNGDTSISLTASPTGLTRYSRLLISTGIYVQVDHVDTTNNIIYVLGYVSGLTATIASGTTITRSNSIETLVPFNKEMITPSYTGYSLAGGAELGFHNNLFSYSAGTTKASLRIYLKYTEIDVIQKSLYMSAPPTSGRWAIGAIAWNTAPTNSTPIGWACVTTGSPGTWVAFGVPNLSGTWSVTTGTVLTAATATYDKVDKQVALSGTFTFATAATAVTITLPYAPDYGGTLVFGNLTFVFTSGSTTATVTSSVADTETFQINYKTA